MKQQLKSIAGSQISDLETQASMSQMEPGPGHYQPKYDPVQVKKNVPMSKAPRFKEPEVQEQQYITPNYRLTQRNAPGTVMKPKTQKNKIQKIKEYEEENQLIQKVQAEIARPVDNDRYTRRNIPGAIISKIDAAPKGSKEKKFMIFYILDKINELRGQGPAYYENEVKKQEPCMVKYRSHSPVARRGNLDLMPEPGPDYYYCKDDLCKTNNPAWVFNKSPRIQKLKLEDFDKKDYDPEYDLVKPRVKTGYLINKEHENESKIPNEDIIINQRLGPGYYTASHKLTEKRDDIGVPKFVEVTEQNDREKYMDPLYQKEVFDNEDLLPNIDATKPSVKGMVVYKPPTEIQPEHMRNLLRYSFQFKLYQIFFFKQFHIFQIKNCSQKIGNFMMEISTK